MHGDVFRACAVVTQLTIENGEPLFEVEYGNITCLYYLMGGGEMVRRGGARGGLSLWSGDYGLWGDSPTKTNLGAGPLNSLNLIMYYSDPQNFVVFGQIS